MTRSIAVVSARGSFCHPASVDRRCDAAGPIRDGQQFSRKGLAPFAEVEGQCHDRGSGLLALGDQGLEVLTLAGHERLQAETVDDQQGIQISVLSLRPILPATRGVVMLSVDRADTLSLNVEDDVIGRCQIRQ